MSSTTTPNIDQRGSDTEATPLATSNDATIVGTIKNYLGFGAEGETKPTDPTSTTPSSGTVLPDRTREPSLEARTNENIAPTTANSSFAGTGSTSTVPTSTENFAPTAANSSFDGTGDSARASALDHISSKTAANQSFDGASTGDSARASALDHISSKTAANQSFDGASTGDRPHGSAKENLTSTNANTSFETTGPSAEDRPAGSAKENLASTNANTSFENDTSRTASNTGSLPDPSIDTSLKGTTTHPAGSANEKPAATEAEEESKDSATKDINSGATAKGLEHPEAIPTAGGEKLGKKHWGESKVVPDNPKPLAEETGVSSSAGQPTTEVQDNTSKNTGSATSGPHGHDAGTTSSSDADKEKLTDKIKDKLHIGKK